MAARGLLLCPSSRDRTRRPASASWIGGAMAWIARGRRRGLGDQALMRGFVPHVRVSSGAAPRLRTGVDASIGHLQSSGVPLPRLRPRRCTMFVASLGRIPPRLHGVSRRDCAPTATADASSAMTESGASAAANPHSAVGRKRRDLLMANLLGSFGARPSSLSRPAGPCGPQQARNKLRRAAMVSSPGATASHLRGFR